MALGNAGDPAHNRMGAVMKDLDDMTEAELAEYYYAMRDEPDFLGEEVGQAEPAKLSTMVSVRFTPEEAAKLRQAAAEADMTLSAYLRQCALTASERPVDIDRLRRDVQEEGVRLFDAMRVLRVCEAG